MKIEPSKITLLWVLETIYFLNNPLHGTYNVIESHCTTEKTKE